jgi:hypothetical protein
MKQNILYSDKLLNVFENGIQFKNYYFPFVSKLVKFSEILTVERKSPTLLDGKWRIWGTSNFTIWYPLDWKRPQRTTIFFLHLASQKIRIGFTVENPERFLEAMESKGIRAES